MKAFRSWLFWMGLSVLLLKAPLVMSVTQQEAQKRYCCHLSEEELDAMRGIHEDCPIQTSSPLTFGGDKCAACPPGACRVRSTQIFATEGCVCAGDFVDFYSGGLFYHRNGCKSNYDGKVWPESVGVENLSLRSCVTTTEEPTAAPTCGKECLNGGIFEAATCSCQCPLQFRGDTCDQCSPNYFGTSCQIYCKASETCSGAGVCSADGRSCQCISGKFGSNCACNAQNCSLGDASACSGNGSCVNSECTCNAGFVGCACELQCSDETTCSGNGRCNQADATCQCNPGFVGKDCATLDLSTYCSAPGQTVSGHPCLPGIIDTLGYGFDAIKGSSTIPVTLLSFTEGRVFTIQGQMYEIPDNVQCSPVTSSDSGFSTSSFSSTTEYRRHQAYSVGLAGEVQSAKNGGYLAASREYEEIYRRSFAQNRHLFASELNHGLYTCTVNDSGQAFILTPDVTRALESLTGDRLVERVGTHYIRKATFGGKLSVFNFVESCVFQSESTQTIRTEIDAGVFGMAGAATAEGSVSSTSSSQNGCSVFEANSVYLKSVRGGKRQLLILPGATAISDFRQWFDSILELPSATQLDQVEHIDFVVLDMTTEIVQGYVEKSQPISEVDLETTGGSTLECALPAACESGAISSSWLLAMLLLGFSVSALLFLL